jgi:hypothetical protein
MMKNVSVKLNKGLPWQKHIQHEEIHEETGLQFEEETNTLLHTEHRFVWR